MSKESDKVFYELWFPRNTQHITIIASPSFDGLEDAKVTSPNYALLDNLGDRDSIYAIGKLLSRRYPKAIIDLKCSDSFSNGSVELNGNLVIIGGPGGSYNDEGEFEGNEVCRLLSKDHIKTKISYSDDCERMILNESSFFQSEYDRNNKFITLDYGYFSAFKNPFYGKTRTIMLHGIHTLGVLGATRIFDGGELDSVNNLCTLKAFIEKHKASYDFETFFKVKVARGWITCPLLEEHHLFFFENNVIKEKSKFPDQNKQIEDYKLKETIIQLITIASNNTTDKERKKSHRYLISKISLLADDDIDTLQKIYSVCLKNENIPENYITEIHSILV